MNEFLGNMQRQGISPELYYQMTGTTEQDLHVQFEGEAETRTKTNLVIEAIVEAENYEVTDEDLEAEIKDLAAQYNMEESAVRGALNNEMLAHDIKMKRAVDAIVSSAKEEA
jgi:trigger factor